MERHDSPGLDHGARLHDPLPPDEAVDGHGPDASPFGRHLAAARQRVMQVRKPRNHAIPSWPRRRPVRWLREYLNTFLVIPLIRAAYAIEVRGQGRFSALPEPCLLISNHNMHMDSAMLLAAMPHGFRQRVAVAAAARDIYGNPLRAFGASLLGNAFPFAKEGSGIRESLEDVAKMLEDGWSILLFPEGKLTVMGPMQPFKGGIGLLARETRVPVLPMRIDVLRPGFYEGKWLPHPRARVRVSVGAPVRLSPDMTYAEATAALEEAVRGA